MDKTSGKYPGVFICLGLALITLAVFRQVRSFDFINYDDQVYVSENRQVQAGLTLEGVKWAFTTNYASNWHPLTWLSHMLDCELFGLDAGRHHLVNLFFHIINTLLLFGVLKAMTGSIWASGFVASLFAIHPLHVESVAWISERKDVLSGFFWMLTMAAYLGYVRYGGIKWYLLTLILFMLGLTAKPMLVTLPFVLLLLDWWPLERIRKIRRDLFVLVSEKVPFFALSAISSMVTFVIQRTTGAMAKTEVVGLCMRVANASLSYRDYIIKMLWPARLALLYPHPFGSLSVGWAVFSGVLLLAISVLVIMAGPRHRYLPVGWFWYLGTLVPVIGLVQVGTQAMADRYSYIPLIGLFIITAWGADELLSGWRERKIVLGGTAIAVVLVLSVCSRLQTRYWRNSETLCRRSLEVTSGNYIMHNNLGYALQSQGKLDEATEHYYLALEIEPDFAETHNNLGIVYQTKGNIEEAMNYYRRAIELAGGHAKAHYNLGAALHSQGRLDAAIFHYRKAIEARPDDAKAHNNLGIALASQGKLDEAIEQYSQGLKAAPDNANIYYNMGTALASQGKLAEATNYYQQALKINPDDAEVHNALGLALSAQGKLDEAVRHYHQALTIRPDYLAPMSGLAWILSTHPEPESRDSKGAIEFALRAAELTGYKDGFVLNTLAACYGAAGRTDDAVRTAQKALELAEAEKDEELANQIRMLLEHYRSGKQ